MVAHTTDDILRALDEAPQGPVQFEDPRTRSRYVLIPHEAYRRILPLLGSPPASTGPQVEWSDTKNDRRIALIKREVAGMLSNDEQAQLQQLQDEFYRYREQVAPLPDAMLELLEEALVRRVSEKLDAAP
jgi:hypothetical protein